MPVLTLEEMQRSTTRPPDVQQDPVPTASAVVGGKKTLQNMLSA